MRRRNGGEGGRGKGREGFLYHLLLLLLCFIISPEAARDCIDLERSVLAPLAGTGKLFVHRMSTGFWCQVKNAGYSTEQLACFHRGVFHLEMAISAFLTTLNGRKLLATIEE